MNNQRKPASIEDFHILEKLGEGSFSQVFKVRRISDQKDYALKRIKMVSLSLKERENALNEIRILASIDDKYIIGYKDAFFQDDGNLLCIIMEYAGGGDLLKQIQDGIKQGHKIEEHEIWKALIHMSLGLRVLHKKGILHRDLKCANIFKTQDGTYKIGDLNVSKVLNGDPARTQTGTPYYAAPEVWADQPYSFPADMWSLGCVIYEMTALKPPFRAKSIEVLYKKVLSGIYDPLPKKYTKGLCLMIHRLLQVNPALRPTCDEVLKNKIVQVYSKAFVESSILFDETQQVQELLKTIKLPLNLNNLQRHLPKNHYDINVSLEVQHQIGSMKEIRVIQSKPRMFSGGIRQQIRSPPIISPKAYLLPIIYYQQLRKSNYFQDIPIGQKPRPRPSISNFLDDDDSKPNSRRSSSSRHNIQEKIRSNSQKKQEQLPKLHHVVSSARLIKFL